MGIFNIRDCFRGRLAGTWPLDTRKIGPFVPEPVRLFDDNGNFIASNYLVPYLSPSTDLTVPLDPLSEGLSVTDTVNVPTFGFTPTGLFTKTRLARAFDSGTLEGVYDFSIEYTPPSFSPIVQVNARTAVVDEIDVFSGRPNAAVPQNTGNWEIKVSDLNTSAVEEGILKKWQIAFLKNTNTQTLCEKPDYLSVTGTSQVQINPATDGGNLTQDGVIVAVYSAVRYFYDDNKPPVGISLIHEGVEVDLTPQSSTSTRVSGGGGEDLITDEFNGLSCLGDWFLEFRTPDGPEDFDIVIDVITAND